MSEQKHMGDLYLEQVKKAYDTGFNLARVMMHGRMRELALEIALADVPADAPVEAKEWCAGFTDAVKKFK